jgi:pimeloyl-ACP methyl ester carboxylesterase
VHLLRLLVFLSVAFTALRGAEFSLSTGRLDSGALYTIAKPAPWTGRVVLLAHAQRSVEHPLHASLPAARALLRGLLDRGCLVAATSFRRNGIILKDAIDDLDALRRQIAAAHGPPTRVYLLGEAMGGAIVTRIIESQPDDYAGAVAISPEFQLSEPEPTVGLSLQPRRPLLLLANDSELDGPRGYVDAASRAPFPPTLWRISRPGHANVNSLEKLASLDALFRWVEDGRRPDPNADATQAPDTGPSQIEFALDNSSGAGRVTAILPGSGDLVVNFQSADLARLGIKPRTRFALVVDERIIRVLYATPRVQAKRDEWFAYPEADGWFALSVLRGNAAGNSRLRVGDSVVLRRLSPK